MNNIPSNCKNKNVAIGPAWARVNTHNKFQTPRTLRTEVIRTGQWVGLIRIYFELFCNKSWKNKQFSSNFETETVVVTVPHEDGQYA